MKIKIFTLLATVLCSTALFAQSNFDKYFEPKTMRVDFALSGNSDFQAAALQQIREEPVWGGPKKNLVDESGYGGYYVNIYDKASGDLIYSRGFVTLFDEWRTTEQANKETQSWTNSVSVPYPKADVVFELTGRERSDMQFRTLLKLDIDPRSIFIDRGRLKDNKVSKIHYSGDPTTKVDLVFLAEGYAADEQDKFVADATRFSEALFLVPPFDTRKGDFNVWGVGLISEDSGTDISGEGIFKNTALNSGFYTFGIDRYITTSDMKSIYDAVWNVPSDVIFVIVNTEKYGGGGMYNSYAISTADNPRTISVFAHELGHTFAGLADEYYSSEVAYVDFYNLDYEPWEPNITTLVDFDAKWKDMLAPKTPIPTPVNDKFKNSLGVFEGGGYLAKGIYRPKVHCMMNDLQEFCPACTRAIHRMTDFISDK